MKPNPISQGRKALKRHMQSVTVANGYSCNAGTNVKTGWFNEVLQVDGVSFPLICIQKGKDLTPKPGPEALIKYHGLYVIGAVETDLDNYEDALDDLEQDLLLALLPSVGVRPAWVPKGVQNITIGAPEQFPPGNGSRAASVLIPVHLHTIIER